MDKCENKNGKLLKSIVDDMNLHILNCLWERIAWCSENSEFTFDYICVNDCALKCIDSAYILERVDVVESDQDVVGVDVEWKVKQEEENRRKRKAERKRRLTVNKWEVYVRHMEGREYEDLSSMNMEMTQVLDELNEEIDRSCEN